MPKRKRDDPSEGDPSSSSVPDFRQQRRIVHAFTQCAHDLTRAFKLARGFERQKLGRRKKTAVAQNDADEVQRINLEVMALKALDLSVSTQVYLAKTLLKAKAVSQSPLLPAEFTERAALTSSDTATLNVTARLCNSNPVKEAMPGAINSVRAEFGLDGDGTEGPGKKKRLRAKDFQSDGKGGAVDERGVVPASKVHAGERVGEVSEDDMAIHDNRLASSDDDSDADMEDDDIDIDSLERQLQSEGIRQRGAPHPFDNQSMISDLPTPSSSASPEPPTKARTAPRSTTVPDAKNAMFLPSLTMGGYISGSGSDVDGQDIEDIDRVPERKNRRGQRARQQIWEKKFGNKAKHLQKESRDQGWDARRGAVASSTNGRGKRSGRVPGPRERRTGANADAVASRGVASGGARPHDGGRKAQAPAAGGKAARDDGGVLHPSWEAAKRAKEKKSVPVKFEGKKIQFD